MRPATSYITTLVKKRSLPLLGGCCLHLGLCHQQWLLEGNVWGGPLSDQKTLPNQCFWNFWIRTLYKKNMLCCLDFLPRAQWMLIILIDVRHAMNWTPQILKLIHSVAQYFSATLKSWISSGTLTLMAQWGPKLGDQPSSKMTYVTMPDDAHAVAPAPGAGCRLALIGVEGQASDSGSRGASARCTMKSKLARWSVSLVQLVGRASFSGVCSTVCATILGTMVLGTSGTCGANGGPFNPACLKFILNIWLQNDDRQIYKIITPIINQTSTQHSPGK